MTIFILQHHVTVHKDSVQTVIVQMLFFIYNDYIIIAKIILLFDKSLSQLFSLKLSFNMSLNNIAAAVLQQMTKINVKSTTKVCFDQINRLESITVEKHTTYSHKYCLYNFTHQCIRFILHIKHRC